MKKTKRQMLLELLEIETVKYNLKMVIFIVHELSLLERKTFSKTSAKRIVNAGVKNEIIEVLTNTENAMTITEVVKSMRTEYSNQKISALMKQLVDSDEVVRTIEKKVARFSLSA